MKIRFVTVVLALAGAAFAWPQGTASSQGITVVVNGQPVHFEGVGAQQVNGRVLVPLRGVMERLGAYVNYQANGRLVTATKGDIDLELKIGQRTARVNGKEVILDVPAQEFRGATLVPLRFMGEALGADVRWDANTYSVMITTNAGPTITANPTVLPTIPTAVSITSFDVDTPGYLRAGSTVNFTLMGTPGGVATVQIPGVSSEIPLTETSPGRYTGGYTVPLNPDKPLTISKASAIAKLRVGGVDRLIQAGTSLQLDTQPPLITSTTPEENGRSTHLRPNITAVFDDEGGSGVDPSSVHITVDNRDVTGDATVTANLVVYKPDQDLTPGRHDVMVSAADRAGNPVSKRWGFTVESNSTVIRSFTLTGTENPQPGDEVTFTLLGDPGAKVSFSIGDRVKSRGMPEVSPGKYVATYTIRRSDQFQNVIAVARLVTTNGDVFTAEANKALGVTIADPLDAPKLIKPGSDDIVDGKLTLHGTAAPGARVSIKVTYSQTLLGLLKTTGTVADLVVDVDQNGNFVTKPIALDTGLGTSNVTYTVTAITLGANDKNSEPATLTIKQ